MRDDLVTSIRGVMFTPVRLREGYKMGEVDRFLDSLEEAVVAGQPLRPLVDTARFTRVRMKESYTIHEVDGFLQDIVTASISEPPAPVDSPAAPAQPGLLSRMFGKNT